MKKNLSILIVILAATLSLAACTPAMLDAPAAPADKSSNKQPTGEIIDGIRHIQIDSLTDLKSVTVYRGETAVLIFDDGKAQTQLTIDDHDVALEEDASGRTLARAKFKTSGRYTLVAAQGKTQVQTTLNVIDYEKKSVYNKVDAKGFDEAMNGEYLLLDVRTQQEYAQGHIQDSTLIPLAELARRLDEIEDYKDKKILVYCRSGNRSVAASQILIDAGFNEIYDLFGGIGAWEAYKK